MTIIYHPEEKIHGNSNNFANIKQGLIGLGYNIRCKSWIVFIQRYFHDVYVTVFDSQMRRYGRTIKQTSAHDQSIITYNL